MQNWAITHDSYPYSDTRKWQTPPFHMKSTHMTELAIMLRLFTVDSSQVLPNVNPFWSEQFVGDFVSKHLMNWSINDCFVDSVVPPCGTGRGSVPFMGHWRDMSNGSNLQLHILSTKKLSFELNIYVIFIVWFEISWIKSRSPFSAVYKLLLIHHCVFISYSEVEVAIYELTR